MSSEYDRKKSRLKRQWSYIDAALKIVQITEQSEKRKYLLEAISKSDYDTFEKLLLDSPTLVDCPKPVGYNYFNIYQIIVERSTDVFIDRIWTQYYDLIDWSTDGGKILVPVACERGDGNILRLLLKYFPRASLDGLSSSGQCSNYLFHDKPRHLIPRELEAFENEMPLACLIRNDRSDLLAIFCQFRSFAFENFSSLQQQQIFHLCLLAEHRQVTIDKYNIKWFKNQSLRPCGSIGCLRFLIEYANFNPLHCLDAQQSFVSPFTLTLEPIYLYCIELHNKLLLDLQMKFHPRLLHALHDLISKQMELFTYLLTHCCLQLTEMDVIRLSECHHFMDEIFHQSQEYPLVRRTMSNVNYLLSRIEKKSNPQCRSLKEICRWILRDYIRKRRCVLVQVEKTFLNWSTSHQKYLKYLM